MTIKKIFPYLIAVFILAIFGYTPASAMTISPVRYEVQGDPGQTLEKEMIIINEDPAPVTYYPSFANFEAQGETGSALFVEPIDDVGTWIKTDKSVTLLPGEQKTVSFSITIPKDAEPGGHFGAIFWGTSPENNPKGEQLAVSGKVGLLILLTVNGEIKEGGGLLDFTTKDNQFWFNSLPVSFIYRFRNDGGDRIKPTGVIKIRNTFFLPTEKLNANPVNGNILPTTIRKFTVDWVKYLEPKDKVAPTGVIKNFFDRVVYQWKNFALGFYQANLDISYGLKSAEKKVSFFVFPWQLLICLAILFISVFFIGGKLIGQYNHYIIKKAQSAMKGHEEASHE